MFFSFKSIFSILFSRMETRSDAWMLLRKELDNLREPHLKQASEEARQAWQANFLSEDSSGSGTTTIRTEQGED